MTQPKKKLIEVALPLEAINRAIRAEGNPFLRGHPRSIHRWWSRKPLSACRAILLAQLFDDPAAEGPTEPATQRMEREQLLRLIEDAVSSPLDVSPAATRQIESILKQGGNSDAIVVDPFAGAGSVAIEAKRLGLRSFASDLNPLAVLISIALADVPARFGDKQPVHPHAKTRLHPRSGTDGLIEDVQLYAQDVSAKAWQTLESLYRPAGPGCSSDMPEAWIWVRTVTCQNPACGIEAPLVASWWLSRKRGNEVVLRYLGPISGTGCLFEVEAGKQPEHAPTIGRSGARCVRCSTPIGFDYLREEAVGGRMSYRLAATVITGEHGRSFVSPTVAEETGAHIAEPSWNLSTPLPERALGFRVQAYGMRRHGDLFLPRQRVAVEAISNAIRELRERIERDASDANEFPDDGYSLDEGGRGISAYAESIAMYLALGLSRLTEFSNTLCTWNEKNINIRQLPLQALPMNWDIAETNVIEGIVDYMSATKWVTDAIRAAPDHGPPATCRQADAMSSSLTSHGLDSDSPVAILTDPPYGDNIGYADLSDLHYAIVKGVLGDLMPKLFSTILTPKDSELVATPYRFQGGKREADAYFESGIRRAFDRLRELPSDEFPIAVFYAFKQKESLEGGVLSTGWENMLSGLLEAGFQITGTWPIRTERRERQVAMGTNALASSILLVCRPRPDSSSRGTRRELIARLRSELPPALRRLQEGAIAPVDMAQAAIGPGMGVFSEYQGVLEADGSFMTVRSALELINHSVDEVLAEQESEFDAVTRWAITWFSEFGFERGPYGVAETLSKAKNTGLNALVAAGIVRAQGGNVRLLRRDELDGDSPAGALGSSSVWLFAQHLVRTLELNGEEGAATVLRQSSIPADALRDLAYRLFSVCESKGWPREATSYNALVASWTEIVKLAGQSIQEQTALDLS